MISCHVCVMAVGYLMCSCCSVILIIINTVSENQKCMVNTIGEKLRVGSVVHSVVGTTKELVAQSSQQ